MGNLTVSRSRGIKVAGPLFDAQAWKTQFLERIENGVRNAGRKAEESAIKDAPVRDIFRHGNAYRKKGLRTRKLTRIEAFSEIPIRQMLKYRNKAGQLVPLAPAIPGVSRTRGRGSSVEPFLRRAGSRKSNPNAYAPTLLSPAHMEEDGILTPARYGGREVKSEVIGGKRVNVLINHPNARSTDTEGDEMSPLHARGRYELRKGRANFKTSKTAQATVGGKLRGEIKLLGPHRIGGVIKAKVISPTPYAMFQEFGTRHNRATPYMRPAILKQITSFRREMVKAINR